MSTRLKWFVYGAVAVILIGAGFYVGYKIKKCPAPIQIDSVSVAVGDTVWAYKDTLFVVKWKTIPAVTTVDSAGVVAKNFNADTSLVSNKDTINIEVAGSYYPEKDNFDVGMNIEHKDYQMERVDTVKTYYESVKEVEVTDPTLITITVTSVIALIALLIGVIFG